jgi:uncharacterized glyoxalase superfamily metalloenzyme YdcJ
MIDNFVPADEIRASFSSAMSAMYREEVPLYGELISLVAAVNADALTKDLDRPARLSRAGGSGRLDVERHGAIRVGTAEELSILRRLFAVMGMHPVGYYDLAAAGIPVHATAFRPIELDALAHSPFRIFTSLLRLELIQDDALRLKAKALLNRRQIVPASTRTLIEQYEEQGGLNTDDAERLVAEATAIFRWHESANVDLDTYRAFLAAHRLVADVVCFQGPHINHLTPRTLDIEAAQAEMKRRGIPAKSRIEGPPERKVPLLLRQTSFHALNEEIRFATDEGEEVGSHTARFGEIEQRGVALTPTGRALYDELLAAATDGVPDGEDERLRAAFTAFPDTEMQLRTRRLAYFQYFATPAGRAARDRNETAENLEELLDRNWIEAEPITYEDFLPVSAAGIFRSNLASADTTERYEASANQAAFETALGRPVLDPFVLYNEIESESLNSVAEQFGLALTPRPS